MGIKAEKTDGTRSFWLSRFTFVICFFVSVGLMIGGFFVPPMGVIDGSVLTAIGELDAAIFLDTYICDVSKELSHAERKSIKLESLGYDMEQIILMSEALDKKYKKKLGW